MFEKKTIKFARTKSGVPALWQNRKDFASMTRHTYILTEEGKMKDPIYIKQNNGSGASYLIPIRQGDLMLKVFFDADGQGVSLLRITEINPYSNVAEVELIRRKPSGDEAWVDNPEATPASEFTIANLENHIASIDSRGKFTR